MSSFTIAHKAVCIINLITCAKEQDTREYWLGNVHPDSPLRSSPVPLPETAEDEALYDALRAIEHVEWVGLRGSLARIRIATPRNPSLLHRIWTTTVQPAVLEVYARLLNRSITEIELSERTVRKFA